jgi:hypothetical protein
VVVAIAVGEALALVRRAALVIAVAPDRVDEILLLIGQSEVHEAAA